MNRSEPRLKARTLRELVAGEPVSSVADAYALEVVYDVTLDGFGRHLAGPDAALLEELAAHTGNRAAAVAWVGLLHGQPVGDPELEAVLQAAGVIPVGGGS